MIKAREIGLMWVSEREEKSIKGKSAQIFVSPKEFTKKKCMQTRRQTNDLSERFPAQTIVTHRFIITESESEGVLREKKKLFQVSETNLFRWRSISHSQWFLIRLLFCLISTKKLCVLAQDDVMREKEREGILKILLSEKFIVKD